MTSCVEENRRRSRDDPEYELVDTGVFDENRYFDVTVEYAKATSGRHPDPHHDHQSRSRSSAARTCCRRCGFAISGRGGTGVAKPALRRVAERSGDLAAIQATNVELDTCRLYAERPDDAALHRERDERRATVRDAQSVAVRQRRDQQRAGRGSPRCRQSSRDGDQSRVPLAPGDRPRRDGGLPLALDRPRRAERAVRPVIRCDDRAPSPREADEFYWRAATRTRSATMGARSSGRHLPGCSGRSNGITMSSAIGSRAIR